MSAATLCVQEKMIVRQIVEIKWMVVSFSFVQNQISSMNNVSTKCEGIYSYVLAVHGTWSVRMQSRKRKKIEILLWRPFSRFFCRTDIINDKWDARLRPLFMSRSWFFSVGLLLLNWTRRLRINIAINLPLGVCMWIVNEFEYNNSYGARSAHVHSFYSRYGIHFGRKGIINCVMHNVKVSFSFLLTTLPVANSIFSLSHYCFWLNEQKE